MHKHVLDDRAAPALRRPNVPVGVSGRRLSEALIFVYVVYGIALFVPATDGGYYFTLRYGAGIVLNASVWNALLAAVLGLSSIRLMRSGVARSDVPILMCGAFFLTYNVVLVGLGLPYNFGYIGALILSYFGLLSARQRILNRALLAAIGAVLIIIALMVADTLLGTRLSPIIANVSAYFAEQGKVELLYGGIFGQGNAGGSAFAFIVLYSLSQMHHNEAPVPAIVFILGFVSLIFTRALGPIAIALTGITVFAVINIGRWRKMLLPLVGMVALGLVVNRYFDLHSFLDFKAQSGSVKLVRMMAFADYLRDRPAVAVIGENAQLAGSGMPFYSESSLIDLWNNFGLLGILLLGASVLEKAKTAIPQHAYSAVVLMLFLILMATQNSSIMPANIIVLLMCFTAMAARSGVTSPQSLLVR